MTKVAEQWCAHFYYVIRSHLARLNNRRNVSRFVTPVSFSKKTDWWCIEEFLLLACCPSAPFSTLSNFIILYAEYMVNRLVAWHSGRTSVSGRRTFPVLRSTCSWWVTTNVGKPSATGQPTQHFILSGSIFKWVVSWNQMCAAVYR